MTNQYLRNITADYITGVVSACEGIRDSLVLLNGPLGCKFYHGYASGQSVVKASELWGLRGELELTDSMDDRLLRSQYFAGTPQVPGSNLRYEDYIFGTREQLRRALNDIFTERSYSLFTVIQTPGTSLLGEALEGELREISEGFGIPYLFIESLRFSDNSFNGYDETMVRLLELLTPPRPPRPREKGRAPVNLFGLYTYERNLEGDIAELTRLLSMCGAEVNCVAGGNCTIESFQRIPEAELNIILSEERCHETVKYLRERYSTPVLDFGCMPVGFDLTERLVREVAEALHTDCTHALEEIDRARARAFYYMARYAGPNGFSGDLRYAVEGEWSLLYGYVDYLSGYLGIRPVAVHPLHIECGSSYREKLAAVLREFRAEAALETDIMETEDAVVLGNANTILELTARGNNILGIETAVPSSGYINVVPKTHLGCAGALYLLEQLLNGARLLGAWK